MDDQKYERIPVFPDPEQTTALPNDSMLEFKVATGNSTFETSVMTWITLGTLLLFYPFLSLLGIGQDTGVLFESMSQGVLMVLLIVTVLFQWAIFLINYAAVYLEKTGLAGLGFRRIRVVDFAWAFAFLLMANLILAGLAWLLAQVGLPMPGEIGLLVPTDPAGKVVWVAVSFTAGFCEEVAFRGYLLTRLRLIGKAKSWFFPVVISSLAFGICHAYQGWPGFIVITTYGAMFALLYTRTGRIWPCIIAHFFQDFSALFFPQ